MINAQRKGSAPGERVKPFAPQNSLSDRLSPAEVEQPQH
jgi:hypothetical protein